eukprot:6174932-Pleurochrysis_carterae.AAC.3
MAMLLLTLLRPMHSHLPACIYAALHPHSSQCRLSRWLEVARVRPGFSVACVRAAAYVDAPV